MICKILEMRDMMTMWPVLCVDMNPGPVFSTENPDPASKQLEQHMARVYHMRNRCGYPCDGRPNIGITHLTANGDKFCNDPFYWREIRKQVAHSYIIDNWDTLRDGDVIDVEFILGEKREKKVSERFGG